MAPVYSALCLDQTTAPLIALRLQRLDLLLTGKLSFSGLRRRGGALGLSGLAVQLLDFAFQTLVW